MGALERSRTYGAKLTVFAFVGTLGTIALAAFSPGGPLSMTHFSLIRAFALMTSVGLALYLGSKLVGYRRERRRRTEAEAQPISESSRKRP